MFEKILYPTDFSDVSIKVLGYVKRLRETGTQEVVALHVIDRKSLDFLFYDTQKSLDAETELIQRAQQDLAPIVDELNRCGFSARARIETADPFREILRIEEEEDVSLIVIGSHGKSNIEEMLLGSVSENVVRKARGPVLVVKR
ncbi:MAG TPA: universal stress protein [Deltaproteobacteria bacterium]|nr:universal stress protein [Deltaproteobacteria bacterium]HPJ94793.1 universal stress protein [Deltaproteobacteria bacterium]HPR52679.1 universal stress protein [Deltaproteobacteria bacterium]